MIWLKNSLIIHKIKNKINERKLDIVFVVFLSYVVFFTRTFFLENHQETMIFVDSYTYLSDAIFINSNPNSAGSFITILSYFYPLFDDPGEAIFYLRLMMIIFSIQLVAIFYLICRKLFNPLYSLIGSLFVSFLPLFVPYSITFHDDIFALSMAFTCLYFSINYKKFVNVALAGFFVFLAVSARADSLIFIIPFLFALALYTSKKLNIKFHILLIIFITVFIGISFYAAQIMNVGLYPKKFDNYIEQIFFFMTYDNMNMVLESIFSLTSSETLNNLYLGLVLVGIIFMVMKHRDYILKILTLKIGYFDEKSVTVIYLVIVFLILLVSLMVFHVGWTFDDAGNLKSSDSILGRYLLGSRIILIPLVLYAFVIFSEFAQTSDKSLITHRNIFSYIFAVMILILFVGSMWNFSVEYSEGLSTIVGGTFVKATPWISKNLKDEIAVLPTAKIFWSLDPSLKDKSVTYNYFWDAMDLHRASATTEEVKKVRQTFLKYITNGTNKVKYVVFNWNDRHGLELFDKTPGDLRMKNFCKNTFPAFNEVKRFGSKTPNSNWINYIVICKVTRT